MKEFNHFAKAVLWLIVSLVSVSTYARLSDSKDYAPTDCIRAMSVNGNSLWLATEGGLVKFDTKTGETTIYNRTNAPIPEDNILSVACNGSSVWFGTRKMGVAKLEKNTVTAFYSPVSGICPKQYNMQFAFDGKGNVWLGSLLAFYKYDGNDWTSFSIPYIELSSMATFNAFTFDHDGKLWFGGMNILSNDVFGYYTESTGVVQIKGINNISAMATDRNGNIWMSTKKSGIVMYDGKTFTKFTAADYDIPTNCTNSLIIDKDNKIWFGADKYLISYDGTNFDKHPIPSPRDNDMICSLLADGDKIWIGSSYSGLYKYNNGEMTHVDAYSRLLPTEKTDSTSTAPKKDDTWSDSDVTTVNTVKQKPDSAEVYDLSGLKVTYPEKGNVYISNGRKFIKK